jgi:hypothetical protein
MTQARCRPLGESARLFFPEGTVSDHIKRAAFELGHNFAYARQMNGRTVIRACKIEPSKLSEAATKMKTEMERLDREKTGNPSVIES